MGTTKLPPEKHRPRKTRCLVSLEEEISKLNDFYWGVRAGFHALDVLSNGHQQTTDFLPPAIAARWAIPTVDMQAHLLVESQRLRYSMIVQAITFYETFLAEILRAACSLDPLPTKKPRLEIDLGNLPLGESVESYIRTLYVEHVVDDVLREKYKRRPGRVAKVLGIDPADTDPELPLDLAAVEAATEIRNCVVHAGGRVDGRAKNALDGVIAGLQIGNPLPLDEALLFKLMGAVIQHAEAVDLLTRMRHPELVAKGDQL